MLVGYIGTAAYENSSGVGEGMGYTREKGSVDVGRVTGRYLCKCWQGGREWWGQCLTSGDGSSQLPTEEANFPYNIKNGWPSSLIFVPLHYHTT
jgi:hypothetical protein